MKALKIRHAVEAIITAFLLALQNMPAIGPWISLMFVPLRYYLILYFVWHPEYLEHNLLILISPRAFFGQTVFITGFIIFIIACIQFLTKRRRLVVTGLYSIVRHPQYLGIVVMTLGLSIMCVQLGSNDGVLYTWVVEVLGYVLLAYFEEHHLLKEHGVEYREYMRKTPFLFPVPSLPKIPDLLFSIIIALIITFLCMFL